MLGSTNSLVMATALLASASNPAAVASMLESFSAPSLSITIAASSIWRSTTSRTNRTVQLGPRAQRIERHRLHSLENGQDRVVWTALQQPLQSVERGLLIAFVTPRSRVDDATSARAW